MKKFFWIVPISFVLASCPFESTVPIAAAPSEKVDSTLFGYWYGIIKDFSDMYGIEALEITQHSDSVYAITRYGKAIKEDMILPDTAYFTGFISYIGNQRFMNIEGSIIIKIPQHKKPPLYRKEKVYYISYLNRRNDTLDVKTITESVSPTRKVFNNPEDLKSLIAESISQQKNIYDDQYSLSYRKIPKPVPLIKIN